MKKFTLIPALALVAFVGFTSCSDDDNDIKPSKVPTEVITSFKAQFPTVSSTKWEEKDGYYVADFKDGSIDKDAWFEKSGKWAMTESDFGRNASMLPEPVVTTLQLPEYNLLTIDDIDYYERTSDSFYVIDLESNKTDDFDLFISPDGKVIKSVADNGKDYKILPTTIIANL